MKLLGDAAHLMSPFAGKTEGEDILFGSFDRLYFEAYDSLFEVGVATIPEPSSWALMVTGCGLVGSAIRRRPALA